MKKFYSIALLALTMGFVFASCDEENEDVKSYTLSVSLSQTDFVYLGTAGQVYGYGYSEEDITIDPFILTHSHADWGWGNSFGEGFTYTNCANDTTPGYTNLSAITKKGVKTNAYFTVNAGGADYDEGLPAVISFKEGKAYKAKECYVTNSTYAYLAIKNHDDGNGEYGMVKEWTDSDVFTLIITGYNGDKETGAVKFKLADGKNIVNTWQQIDLSSLGQVTSIKFNLTSTDSYNGYSNTPAYFCLDQLTVTE
ncbi:MAG: DUF4465 domain-containing protein [Bacteroidaceae bacterium]|nr:DUF4465 domain-containing protein [Bacteroidaceae bacterium]